MQDVYYRLVEDRPSDPEDVASLNRRLLDGVSRYFDDFVAANRDEPDALADVAEARTRSAMIARAVGLNDQAASQFRKAIDLWRGLIDANPANDAYRERLAKAEAELGRSLEADGGKGSNPDEALAAFESARELLTSLADAHPNARPLRRELAGVLRAEAEIHDRRDRLEAADKLLRRAILLQEELDWENAYDLDARLALASDYGFMARLDARGKAGRRRRARPSNARSRSWIRRPRRVPSSRRFGSRTRPPSGSSTWPTSSGWRTPCPRPPATPTERSRSSEP